MRDLLNQERNFAALARELYRVAQNIYQHLLEFHVVADIKILDAAANCVVVAQTFFLALPADHRVDLLQHVGERKFLVLENHAPAFDSAHVQDVVDDAEKMPRTRPDFLKVFAQFF